MLILRAWGVGIMATHVAAGAWPARRPARVRAAARSPLPRPVAAGCVRMPDAAMRRKFDC